MLVLDSYTVTTHNMLYVYVKQQIVPAPVLNSIKLYYSISYMSIIITVGILYLMYLPGWIPNQITLYCFVCFKDTMTDLVQNSRPKYIRTSYNYTKNKSAIGLLIGLSLRISAASVVSANTCSYRNSLRVWAATAKRYVCVYVICI